MPIGSRIQGTCGLEKQAWLLSLPEANLTWLYSRPRESESPSRGAPVACNRLESGRARKTHPGERGPYDPGPEGDPGKF